MKYRASLFVPWLPLKNKNQNQALLNVFRAILNQSQIS
jgi:hypothetical protein